MSEKINLKKITINLTTTADGSFPRLYDDNRDAVSSFLDGINVSADAAVRVRMSYDREDFTRYAEVRLEDAGKVMSSDIDSRDGLATIQQNVTLFLPLADCIGAVLYDTVQKALMVSHLGRHNTEQYGARESVRFMQQQFNSLPGDIMVWLSPAAGVENYPLFAFEHKSLHEITTRHLLEAGIKKENLIIDSRDTTIDKSFFSHSEFLKGNRSEDGRFIITATISN